MILNFALIIFLASAIAQSPDYNQKLIAWIVFGITAAFVVKKKNNLNLFLNSGLILIIGSALKEPSQIIITGIVVYLLFSKIKKYASIKILLNFTLFAIITGFLAITSFQTEEIIRYLNIEPKFHKYTRDPIVFLNTFYQMSKGSSYYNAFSYSYDGDFRTKGLPYDLWAYRPPAVFIFWKLFAFNSPANLYFLFLVYSTLTLILSYLVAKKLLGENIAIITPFMLVPYLLFGSSSLYLEFLQMDWWGILPIFILIYGALSNKFNLMVLGGSLALLTRELYLIPLFGAGLVSLIFKKFQLSKSLIISLLIFLITLLIHAFFVSQRVPINLKALSAGRMHEWGFEFVHQVLANGSFVYLFAQYRIFTLYALLAIILGGTVFLKNPSLRFIVALLISLFVLTLIAFLRIGLCCWTDNWGVVVDPFIILSFTLMFGLFIKNQYDKKQIN